MPLSVAESGLSTYQLNNRTVYKLKNLSQYVNLRRKRNFKGFYLKIFEQFSSKFSGNYFLSTKFVSLSGTVFG